MRIVWIFSFALLLPSLLCGQGVSHDAERVLQNFLRQLPHLQRDSFGLAHAHLRRVLPSVSDPHWRIRAYAAIGDYFGDGLFQFDSSQVYYQKSFGLLAADPDSSLRAQMLIKLASNCYRMAQLSTAHNYGLEALALARQLGNRGIEAQALSTLAAIMIGYVEEPQKALAYQQEAQQIYASLRDTQALMFGYIKIASAQSDIYGADEALRTMENALRLLSTATPRKHYAEVQYWTAYFLLQKKEYDRALEMLEKTMPIYESLNDQGRIMHVLLDFGTIELAKGRPAKAIEHCQRILNTPALSPGFYERSGANRLLYEAYKMQGDANKALYYHEAYFAVEDSLRRMNKDKDIAALEMQFHTKENESQLKQQELALALSQDRQRNTLIGLFAALAMLGIVAFAWLRVRRASRRLAEQNEVIRRQKEVLQQADELKSRFFANVSHELRTPVALMLGPVEQALQENGLGPRKRRFLEMAQRNGQHLLALINQLLELNRLESAASALNETPTPVAAFFSEILERFGPAAEAKRVALNAEQTVGEGVWADLDRPKLNVVVGNLLSNAIKFTPEGGTVILAASSDGAWLHLEVRDTGAGISPEDLPHIFERYYQSKRAGLKAEGGFGIGLSLVQESLKAMGGSVSVRSAVGQGSVFDVALPLKKSGMAADAAAAALGGESSAASPKTQHRPQVLLAEDNPDLREFIRMLLPTEAYELQLAENGRAALTMLETAQRKPPLPDLLITDLMMPEMDGFELLQRLKADTRWAGIPVLVLTARTDAHAELQALRIGVDDYLIKPFDTSELLSRMEHLLRYCRERQKTAEASTEKTELADNAWLSRLEAVALERIGEPKFNLDTLSEALGLSARQLQRRLKAATGLTATQYLQELRLRRARQVLEMGQAQSVKSLCETVGLRDVKYFSQEFKKRFGKPPSAYLS
jgi:signal transduction histidine kinase/AraC-like DNA-binding protein